VRHFQRWGVVWFLAALGLSFNVAHFYFEWAVTTYDTEDEVPFQVEWARSTFENLQSEVWQIALACLVVDAVRRTRFWFRAKEEE